jgi:hypothetical protein
MTEPQQPPAGWYPDPQDANQQRYWDGTSWTGHTAAPSTSMPAPQGAATAGAPIPTSAAPAWAMQPSGIPVGAKKAWYKRLPIIIPLSIVAVLIIVGIIVALVQGPDHSKGLERIILRDGQPRLQATISQIDPGATVKITKVHCVESGSSQQYSCLAYFTVTSPSGTTTNFTQHVSATCNKKFSATCIWHADGEATRTPG